MSFPIIDLALRAATVAMLLVLAATLFRDFRHVAAGRLAVAFVLGSAAHAVTYAIGSPPPVPLWRAPVIALSTGNIVVFWLFTRALFDETFRLRWWHAAVWLAVAAFSLVNCTFLAGSPGGGARLSVIAINLLVLGFIALALVQTFASWSADLVEDRRRVRVFIVVAAALYGGLNAVLHLAIPGGDAAEIANAASGALLAGVVAAICVAMLRVGGADVFAAVPAAIEAAPQADTVADRKLVDALMRLIARFGGS